MRASNHYLRRAVENRIRDELRRAVRRRDSIAPDEGVRRACDATGRFV